MKLEACFMQIRAEPGDVGGPDGRDPFLNHARVSGRGGRCRKENLCCGQEVSCSYYSC